MKLSEKQVKKLTELHAGWIAARDTRQDSLIGQKARGKRTAAGTIAKLLTSEDGRKAIELARDANKLERDALRSLRKYVTKITAG